MENKEHVGVLNLTQFKSIKQQINNKLVYFDWTHINSLFNY